MWIGYRYHQGKRVVIVDGSINELDASINEKVRGKMFSEVPLELIT